MERVILEKTRCSQYSVRVVRPGGFPPKIKRSKLDAFWLVEKFINLKLYHQICSFRYVNLEVDWEWKCAKYITFQGSFYF